MTSSDRHTESGIASGGIRADDVANAYRWLLGREPESRTAIEAHLTSKDRDDLRRRMLLSPEFRDKFHALTVSAPDGPVSENDVTDAYRWLLGREPESRAAIEAHLTSKNGYDLRKQMLRSQEFRDKFEALEIPAPGWPDRYVPESADRLVLLHVPKTGGTTLHALLVAAVGEDQVAPQRHNKLWHCSGAELAGARLFSGHYDRRCLSFIPGRRGRVVTILREPRQRLLSIYRFLRAHRARLVAEQDLALAGAAREMRFGDFLRAAAEINPATVDNTYLRAFGAHLPHRRWEQRAEPGACHKLDDLGAPVAELMRRATAFLDDMAAVGILEDFDRSLDKIFAALGLDRPPSYEVKQRLADLIANDPNFEAVEDVAVTAEDERLVADLTRFDQQLYLRGRSILARGSKIRLVTPPPAKVAKSAASGRPAAGAFASNVLPIVRQIAASGVTEPRAIAAALNARGIPTVRGSTWQESTVRKLLARA